MQQPQPVSPNYNSNAWTNSSPNAAWQQRVTPNSVRNVRTTSPTASNSSWNSPPPQPVASSNSTWTPPTPPSYSHDRLREEYDSYNENLLNHQAYNNYNMSYDRYCTFFVTHNVSWVSHTSVLRYLLSSDSNSTFSREATLSLLLFSSCWVSTSLWKELVSVRANSFQ